MTVKLEPKRPGENGYMTHSEPCHKCGRTPTHNIAVQWLDGAWWCWGCIYRAVVS